MSLVSELDHLTAKHRKAQGLKSAFLLVKTEGHLGSCQGNLKIRQGPENTHSWDPQGQTWASWRSRLIFPAAVPSATTILWLLCIVCLIRLWARPYQCPSNLEAAKWLLRRWRGARGCLDTAPVSASFSCILLFFNTHSLEERLYPKGDVVLVLVAVTSIWGEATWRRKDSVCSWLEKIAHQDGEGIGGDVLAHISAGQKANPGQNVETRLQTTKATPMSISFS